MSMGMGATRRRAIAAIRVRAVRLALRAAARVKRRDDLVRLGSSECGWVVPTRFLVPSAVCYCAGAGEDISFDLALADSYAAEVVTIDPTPRAITHAERQIKGRPNMRLLPVGLWKEDATLRFYSPRDPKHVSHSIVNLQGTDSYFEARCLRVSSVMRLLGHPKVTFLKLDIEGAQFAVLEDVLAERIPIDVICVEFDQPSPFASSLRMLRSMSRAGYSTVSLDGLNLTFVRDAAR